MAISRYTVLLMGLTWLTVGCSSYNQLTRYSYQFKERPRPYTPPVSNPGPVTDPGASADLPSDKPERMEYPVQPASPSSPSTGNSRDIDRVIATAESYLGTPYRYGGMSRNGIDCSALTYAAYQSINKTLPRTSREQARVGTPVPRKKIRPGNLIFFATNGGSHISHVALASKTSKGDVEFIHASTSSGVRKDMLSNPYWSKRFVKAVELR